MASLQHNVARPMRPLSPRRRVQTDSTDGWPLALLFVARRVSDLQRALRRRGVARDDGAQSSEDPGSDVASFGPPAFLRSVPNGFPRSCADGGSCASESSDASHPPSISDVGYGAHVGPKRWVTGSKICVNTGWSGLFWDLVDPMFD